MNPRLSADWRPALELVTASLPHELRQAVLERYGASLGEPEAEEGATYWAFIQALQAFPEESGTDARPEGWWLCVHLDWKNVEDLTPQVQAVARTLGLSPDFEWDLPAEPDSSHVPPGLGAATRWLEARGIALILMDTESDEYVLLPVHQSRAPALIACIEANGFRTDNLKERR